VSCFELAKRYCTTSPMQSPEREPLTAEWPTLGATPFRDVLLRGSGQLPTHHRADVCALFGVGYDCCSDHGSDLYSHFPISPCFERQIGTRSHTASGAGAPPSLLSQLLHDSCRAHRNEKHYHAHNSIKKCNENHVKPSPDDPPIYK